MNRAIFVVLLCGATGFAQTKFSAPLVGVVRDTEQHLRLVNGVAGNFVLGVAISAGAIDWAFGPNGGLLKTDAESVVLGAHGVVMRTVRRRGAVRC